MALAAGVHFTINQFFKIALRYKFLHRCDVL